MNTHTDTHSTAPRDTANSLVWTLVAFAVVAVLAFAAFNYYSADTTTAYDNAGSPTVTQSPTTDPARENTLGD